ncbi:MAG: hypothetical protein Q9195_001424 [Heterodermia aff. obscurata]
MDIASLVESYINRPYQANPAGREQQFGSQPYRSQQQPAVIGQGQATQSIASNRNAYVSQPNQPEQSFRQNYSPVDGRDSFQPDYQSNYSNRTFQPQAKAYFEENKEDAKNIPPDYEYEYTDYEHYENREQPADDYHGEATTVEQQQEKSNEYQNYFVDTPPLLIRRYICRKCHEEFSFNNKLHAHVRRCKVNLKPKLKTSVLLTKDDNLIVIKSTASILAAKAS